MVVTSLHPSIININLTIAKYRSRPVAVVVERNCQNLRMVAVTMTVLPIMETDFPLPWVVPLPLEVECLPLEVEHLPLVVEHLPFAVEHLPLVVEHLPLVVEHLPFAVEHLPFAVEHLPLVAASRPLEVPDLPSVAGRHPLVQCYSSQMLKNLRNR